MKPVMPEIDDASGIEELIHRPGSMHVALLKYGTGSRYELTYCDQTNAADWTDWRAIASTKYLLFVMLEEETGLMGNGVTGERTRTLWAPETLHRK